MTAQKMRKVELNYSHCGGCVLTHCRESTKHQEHIKDCPCWKILHIKEENLFLVEG